MLALLSFSDMSPNSAGGKARHKAGRPLGPRVEPPAAAKHADVI